MAATRRYARATYRSSRFGDGAAKRGIRMTTTTPFGLDCVGAADGSGALESVPGSARAARVKRMGMVNGNRALVTRARQTSAAAPNAPRIRLGTHRDRCALR